MSLSVVSLEVFFLYPAAILYILMVLPIPGLSRYVGRLIAMLENIRLNGISVFVLIAAFGCILFSTSFFSYRKKFGKGGLSDNFVLDSRLEGGTFAGQFELRAKRWKAERDMYVHALLCLTYLGLMRMARLVIKVKKISSPQNVQVSEKKKSKKD